MLTPLLSRWYARLAQAVDWTVGWTKLPPPLGVATLLGMRLTLRPFSMLEIGLTRTAQWGGRGHSQTLKSFVKMLLGMRLNAQGPAQQAADPANEMAGIDLRLRCPRGVRCATYAQLVAEDEGGHVPTRYLGLFGIESWSADGRERYFGEFAETIPTEIEGLI